MRNNERFIIKNWNLIVISLATIWYGFEIAIHPNILIAYNIYKAMQEIVPPNKIGIMFVMVGLIMILSLLTKNKRIERFVITLFIFVWSFYSISFFIALPENTVKIFGTIIVLVIVGETMKDVSR